jgi:tetratricopeptide (TPR) repeat protein
LTTSEMHDLVKRGLELHRDGDLESAGKLYATVLENDWQRSDALHLFGILLHQFGDHFGAIQAISRAIALNPTLSHFHLNLSEIYRVVGKQERAEGCLYLAVKLQPDRFQDPNLFDLLIQRPGQFDEIRIPARRPPAIVPDQSVEHTEIAVKLLAKGNTARASEHFAEAVRHAPGVGEPHSNLGQTLLLLGRIEEAFYHANEATRLAPDQPEPWNHLGNILRAMGRSIEARSSYLESLRIAPDSAIVLNNLGMDLLATHRPKEALTWFRIALEFEPASVIIRSNFASSLKELGMLEEAVNFAETTLRLAPDIDLSHLTLGSIYHELRRFEDAKRSFLEAIRINPKCTIAHESLGVLLTEMGDLENSERSFREVLGLPGDHTRALVGLSKIDQANFPDTDYARICQLMADPNIPDPQKAELHFAAAQVDDARGDYARSASNLQKANGIRIEQNSRAGRSYRPHDHEDFIDRMMAICSPEFFERTADFGRNTTRLVFIFGLPRSGTSLTEQILASHTQVHGLGETDYARRSLESLPRVLKTKELDLDCFARIDRETTDRMAVELLDKFNAIDSHGPLIVDKMPDNYLYLGYLATLFPRARFIHCRRDLRDNAVSCWSTNFWFLEWPSHFEHIASRFQMHQRLMAYWENVLPAPILQIDYEETVKDLETTARKLLDWCGLDWEPSCLDFHKSKRVVRTASVTQVRQPIYRRSVERWRNYETELAPLFERLEPAIKV